MGKRAEKQAAMKRALARIAASKTAVLAVIESGACPDCKSGLRRNLSLTGWWQCEQFGADGFRKDSAKPQCGWQGFV